MKQTIIPTISLMTLLVGPIHSIFTQTRNHVEVYVTAKDMARRLVKTDAAQMSTPAPESEKEEYIPFDPAKTFPTAVNICGALTDASAETFYKLPADMQQEIVRPILIRNMALVTCLTALMSTVAIFRAKALHLRHE